MNPSRLITLLFVVAALEFLIGIVMFAVFHNPAIGASNVAIGGSLIAIAASTRKKQNNG